MEHLLPRRTVQWERHRTSEHLLTVRDEGRAGRRHARASMAAEVHNGSHNGSSDGWPVVMEPKRGEVMSIQSINPATGEVVETFEETPPQGLERILSTAHATFIEWRQTSFGTRALLMRKAAEILRTRKNEYARTMAL